MLKCVPMTEERRIEAKKKWAEKMKPPLMKRIGTQETPPVKRDRLPPGQHLAKDWPVLDLGIHPEIPLAAWRLKILGECENPCELTWDQFLKFPQSEDASDFHCVTTWSTYDNKWSGVRFCDLAAAVKPTRAAKFAFFTAHDGLTVNVPLAELMKPEVMLVHTWNGQPLPREHGGPCRVVTPQLYAWKGAKWVKSIEFMTEDRLGFWEVRGYSNTADPWKEERFS